MCSLWWEYEFSIVLREMVCYLSAMVHSVSRAWLVCMVQWRRSRAHELLSHAHDLLSCAHNLLSRAHNLLSCGHDLLSCAHNLLSRAHNLLSCAHDVLSGAHDVPKGAPYLISSLTKINTTEYKGTLKPDKC